VTSSETEPVAPIAEGGLLLHIGSPKAGSTAIQNALNEQRALLAEHGAHYAGRGYRRAAAGWAVLGKKAPAGHPQADIVEWEKLVAECRDHAGQRVCLSNEALSWADDESAERIVRELGPDRVNLLYVVRPLERLLPSTWQERIKARVDSTYDEWLRIILGEPSKVFEYANYWGPRDLPTLLERWGRLIPAERITLICLDERDRELLPRAFESLLGLPAGSLPLQSAGRANRGLTANEAELMRRINLVARSEKWSAEEYLTFGQRGVAAELRRSEPSPSDVKSPALPGWAAETVRELSDRTIETVLASGARVIGDPESLRSRPAAQTAETPEISSVQIDTAVAAVLGAISGGRRCAREQRSSKRKRLATTVSGPSVSDLSSKELAKVIAGRARAPSTASVRLGGRSAGA
jgi:hypothetical protein